MWSFSKPRKTKNTDKYRANSFGFYSINGSSVIEFHENSRKEDICSFLEGIRNANPGKPITMVLDNFASHRSGAVRKRALELGIRLVFLPLTLRISIPLSSSGRA